MPGISPKYELYCETRTFGGPSWSTSSPVVDLCNCWTTISPAKELVFPTVATWLSFLALVITLDFSCVTICTDNLCSVTQALGSINARHVDIVEQNADGS